MDKQYLTPPAGFETPQGTQQDGEFDVALRVKREPDGRLCVKSINGTPVGDAESEKEDAGEDEETEMPSNMTMMGAATKDGYG